MQPNNKGLSHLTAATRYSIQGLRVMWQETAFRQELFTGVIALPAVWLVMPFIGHGVSLPWRVFLTVLWLMLPTMEIVNTAIEKVVNLVSPDFHPLAGQAKDLGSAAVFCACVANVIGWLVTLALLFMG